MLRDVVATFLDTASEREFDAPLLALLSARGFDDIHFLHGVFEFGKDFIAKGPKPPNQDVGEGDPIQWVRHQFALQSKAGDIGLPAWREVRPQMDEARLNDLAHPDFDTTLPRAGVLVLTGRLVGGATLEAQSYRVSEVGHGRPDFEVWDRETLLAWLADSPEVGLAGTSDGPLLTVSGAIDAGSITLGQLEQFSRRWLPPAPGTISAATTDPRDISVAQRRASVEAAVLANRLRKSGRLDLAAHVGLCLLRAGWSYCLASQPVPSARPPQAEAAIRLFVGYATDLFREIAPLANDPQGFLTASARSPLALHSVYPATCGRVTEVVGLLGLLGATLEGGHPLHGLLPSVSELKRTVSALLFEQPGTAHPIGDSFAVGLIAPVLLVSMDEPERVRDFIVRAAVWVADRYDKDQSAIGLAGTGATPIDEIRRLLSGPYVQDARRRPESYLACVLTDLAGLLSAGTDLYTDVVNEFLAVDVFPQCVLAGETRAHWKPGGPGTRLIARVEYRDSLPADGIAAQHFAEPAPPVPSWDAVALASTVRDRHSIAAMKTLLAASGPTS